jgi:hypothetical protein
MTHALALFLMMTLLLAALPALTETLAPGQVPNRRSLKVDAHFEDRERTRLTVEATNYAFTLDLTRPRMTTLVNRLGGKPEENLLRGHDLALRATLNGKVADSRRAPKKARLNIWRHGLYYYEIHLLDFPLGFTEDGSAAPLLGELVFYCYPEKFHVQAFLRPSEAVTVYAAGMDLEPAPQSAPDNTPPPLALATAAPAPQGKHSVVTLSSKPATTLFYIPHKLAAGSVVYQELAKLKPGNWPAKSEQSGWFAVLPARSDEAAIEAALTPVLHPLPASAFRVEAGGVFTGYDAARGVYVFQTAQAPAPTGFEANWVNPNTYPSIRFTVQNDGRPRHIYIEQISDTGGSVEAAVVCDANGWPLPIPVQTCKNFAGENEEPDDTPFSESYFPLRLQPKEKLTLIARHLFQNWGNHPLKQISSIRFFEHYWHMSTGVTETTCHVPFTKPAYPNQGYNVPDFRGMSGITWLGQPQHHHVALHGFLQYNDGEWRYLRYLDSALDYVAPCFAQFTTRYITDDNKIRVTVTIFEAPQTDETRTFTRVRFDVDEPVTIVGDARQNLKLFTGNTDITRNPYQTVAWLGTDGQMQTKAFQYDDTWPLLGEPLGAERPITCLYASDKSNNAFVVLKYGGRLGGKPLEKLGVSLVAYKNRVADHILTVTEPNLRLEKGDWFEADVILMPYGDDTSDWRGPFKERTYYGSAAPQITVQQGRKILDFPATVKAQDSVAEFTLTGGHNALPLIVQGMAQYAVPLLWEEAGGVWQWVNPQVCGGDGYQVQDGPDGGYEFVFTVKQRNGMSHHYLVTQAHAEAGITAVTQRNHCLVITAARKGAMRIVGPRLFVGFAHTLKSNSPALIAEGEAKEAVAAPMSASVKQGTARLLLQRYSATEIAFQAEGAGTLALNLSGLKPNAAYRFRAGAETRVLHADRAGRLTLEVTPGGTIEARLTLSG